MPLTYLPDEHHVLRYVPWARLRKDEDENVIGVLSVAFRLRANEQYLSVTWAEFFQCPTHQENIHAAVKAVRASDLEVKPKSGFAVGNVGAIKKMCIERPKKHKIRVIHEEEPDNKAHTAMRGWPDDDEDLLELLAEDTWSKHILNSEVP